ncbi:hypothetical protein P3X46_035194 [Hevea brasiliensis]|uniref:Disease resistance protein At4g27190-like leucine-rich repeats domain-containing protein n=1 Tax=Hevea brasiliensis TaxID=3981 RepID=A0ABQ9KBJ0_HEVBR|nr:hypothetical protein P3X46_035194 [Hevea brasiliensis]
MEELKVLDLTGMHLSPLPLSLQYLKHLETLCLDGCVLEDISAIGELKKLQVLSFVQSTIVRLPSEVRKLTRLRLLDLRRCQGLEVISPDVLSRLARLEELYIGDGFVQWKGEGHDEPRNNANLSELKLLSKLSTLEVHIMDANIMPKDLFSEKLERFRVFIGDEWDWDWHEYERYADYRSLRTLKLKLSRSALLERVKVLLMKTEDLYLDDLRGLRSVLYELDDQGFPELKHLHVQNSLGIQYIIDWMIMGHSTAFPRLESLFIENLHNLEKIYYGPYMVGSFSNLRKLKVGNCNALRSLFSFSMFKGLGKLEEVDVSSCEIMEEIAVEEGEDDEEINLTQIRSLTLDNLPQLTSFCSQGQEKVCSASQRTQKEAAVGTSSKEIVCEDEIEALLPLFSKKIGFPNLEDIKLSGINVKMIWPNQHIESSLYIEKLTTLIVDGCGNLNYLFTSSIVGSLAQLKTLEICECKSMEEVIIAEGEGEMMSKMLFPKLHSLKLKGLPRIVRFCTANLIECPSLKVLRVDNCPHLHAFLSTCTSKNVGTSSGVTQANATLFDEKVWFPNLEELYIMHMHKLEMIWCDELLADSFSRLKVLQVQYGKQLLKIFPSKLLGRFLQNLELLVVKNCDSVEEVFDLRALVRVSEAPVVERSQLRTLDIRDLPNLKQVWNMDPHGILSFYNLRLVYAWNCPKLKSLFPFSIAIGLPHLALLNINGCGMEEVVAKEESVEAITINPKFVFRGLKALILWQLEELRCFYSEKHSLECTQLKHLCVYRCEKLKTFNSESQEMQEILMNGQESQLKIQVPQPLFAFREIVGNLEQLALNNEDIAMMQQSHFPIDLFFKLKILVLQSFHDASVNLPFNIFPKFPNLEKLVLGSCYFRELLPHGVVSEDAGVLLQSQIRFLKLDFLPNIRHIWNQDCQPVPFLQNLETLEIWRCHRLTNLAPSSATFKNLAILNVWKCQGLLSLISSSTAKSMVNLTTMIVRESHKVEEIVSNDRNDSQSQSEIVLWKLRTLKLLCLKSLSSFCSSANCTLKFPSLEELIVTQCPRMKIFSQGAISAPKLKRVNLAEERAKWRWIGNLNSTIIQLYTEKLFRFSGQLPSFF